MNLSQLKSLILGCFIAHTTIANGQIIQDGLVDRWGFDNSTTSDGNIVLSLEENISYVSGVSNQAVEVGPTSTLKIPNSTAIANIVNSPNGFTFSGWINDFNAPAINSTPEVWGTFYSTYNLSLRTYKENPATASSTDDRAVHFSIHYNDNTMLSAHTPFGSIGEGWHHVAITFSANRDLHIYVNGQEMPLTYIENSTTGQYKGDLNGGTYFNERSVNVQPFDGQFDEFLFYNRTLSANEIGLLHDPNFTPNSGSLWQVSDQGEIADFNIYYDQGAVSIGGEYTPPTTTQDYQEYLLFVKGKARLEGVKVELYSEWPDYVFADDYELPSLEEIENFVITHHHLPGVPNAEEVSQTGIELAQMDEILLKKIEELTLYIIDQDKQIKEQARQLEAMQGLINQIQLEKVEE